MGIECHAVPLLIGAFLVVHQPEKPVKNVESSILGRDVKFEDLATLTPKAKSGKTWLDRSGSGFFVSEFGDVISNHHVVDGAAELVAVWSNMAWRVYVVASDKDADLALLRPGPVMVELDKDIDFNEYKWQLFPKIDTDFSGNCDVGDTIYVIGYPNISLQGMEVKVTRGIVSSQSGFKGQKDNFQMDAAIQGGNSGGPVVNERGQLVGVSVATLRGGQNVNYAIKLSALEKFLDGRLEIEKTSSPRISGGRAIREAAKASVLILNYAPGSRPLPFDDETRDVKIRNEERAMFEKKVLYARLLKVRKEWKDLKKLTDALMKEFGESAGEDVRELNELAKKKLGETDENEKAGKESEK